MLSLFQTKIVISQILDYPDVIMHVALYEWMVSKNMTSDLIKINQPSLETYLKRASKNEENNVPVMNLLWKYYESNGNHAAAAKILHNLACQIGYLYTSYILYESIIIIFNYSSTVTLRERLTYLARAIMCMRSDKVGYAPCLGVFLRDLEDKMEVAKVQEQILNAIINLEGSHPRAQEAINALNSGLYEISQVALIVYDILMGIYLINIVVAVCRIC